MKLSIGILAISIQSIVSVTPVEKVISILENMHSRGSAEKRQEELNYAKFTQFCKDTTSIKKTNIARFETDVERFNAAALKGKATAKSLRQEVARMTNQVGRWTDDLKSAKVIRKAEKAEYDQTHQDYSESLDALDRAVIIVKRNRDNLEKSPSFLQSATLFSEKSRLKLLQTYLKNKQTSYSKTSLPDDDEQIENFLNAKNPEQDAYEWKAGGVLDMLRDLKTKFFDERSALEKQEADRRHSYEMVTMDLTNSIENYNEQIAENQKSATENEQNAGASAQKAVDAQAELDADRKYLTDLTIDCKAKSSEFDDRQKLRSEELHVINEAVKILKSSDVSGHSAKYIRKMTQTEPAEETTSFAQFFSKSNSHLKITPTSHLKTFLLSRAETLDSKILSLVASKVGDNDPFAKVRDLLTTLINRLQAQAADEAQHKIWCDGEIKSNTITREQKSAESDKLHAESEKLKAEIADLGNSIVELEDQISGLNKALSEAKENRAAEKETNDETVADAKDGQMAIAKALVVLKDYYSKAAGATVFIQKYSTNSVTRQEPPVTWDEGYTGMQEVKGGVIAFLETIQADFARLEADTTAAEAKAKREYDQFSTDTKVDIGVKTNTKNLNTQTKIKREGDLNMTNRDLTSVTDELNAAMDYWGKLKETCMNPGVSYDERVQKRAEEIQSLKEALAILEAQ